jgi:hypothetical protein
MFRKSIFLGLMLMLGAVLVWLILKARKEEAQTARAPVEIVRTARLSPTRAIGPKDLDATESRVEIIPSGRGQTKTAGRSAHAHVVIRNHGTVAYRDIMLKLTCLGGNGKVIDTRTRLVPETIQPGQTLTVNDMAIENLPNDTVRCRISILYSDLGPAASH